LAQATIRYQTTLAITSVAAMVNSYGTGPQVAYAPPAEIKPTFARGQRRRMNLAAICFSLFVPWVLFSVIYAVFSFSLHYRQPAICYFIAFLGLLVVGAFGYLAFYAKNWQDAREPGREPSWFVFLFVTSLAAWLAAIVLGDLNFWHNMQRYYDTRNLNTYPSVDPSRMRGQQLMDAGNIIFTEGSRLDLTKSMGFKNDDVYCVAPITTGDDPLATYDFWAVGINCCSGNAADFHCGEFNNPRAQAGLRLMRDDQRAFFRLAVQQAESAYNVQAVHPLFFHWLQDPVAEVNSYQDDGFKYYLLGMFTHFAVQLFLVVVGVLAFSKIGYY